MANSKPASDGNKNKAVTIRLPKLRKNRLKNFILMLVVIGLAVFAYEYIHTRNQLEQLSNPSTAGQSQSQQIANQIGKTIALPQNETPTLATVTNVAKLRNQNFFRYARDGDKVLIYSKSGQAVLYRPSTKQVIEFAPVSFNQ